MTPTQIEALEDLLSGRAVQNIAVMAARRSIYVTEDQLDLCQAACMATVTATLASIVLLQDDGRWDSREVSESLRTLVIRPVQPVKRRAKSTF